MFGIIKDKPESINIKDIDSLIGSIQLIDVREEFEFRTGSIKGAKNIPMNSLLSRPESYLKKDQKCYIMCQSGMRSKRVAKALKKQGYDVVDVRGGMSGYTGKNK